MSIALIKKFISLYISRSEDDYYINLLFITEDGDGLLFDGINIVLKESVIVSEGFIKEIKGSLYHEFYKIQAVKETYDLSTVFFFESGTIWYLTISAHGYGELYQTLYVHHESELNESLRKLFYDDDDTVDKELTIE